MKKNKILCPICSMPANFSSLSWPVLDRSRGRDGLIAYHEPFRPAIITLITTKIVLTNNLEQDTTLGNPAIAVQFIPSIPNAFRTNRLAPPAAVHTPSTRTKALLDSSQMPVVSVVGMQTSPG
jgi:hypothetical protein